MLPRNTPFSVALMKNPRQNGKGSVFSARFMTPHLAGEISLPHSCGGYCSSFAGARPAARLYRCFGLWGVMGKVSSRRPCSTSGVM